MAATLASSRARWTPRAVEATASVFTDGYSRSRYERHCASAWGWLATTPNSPAWASSACRIGVTISWTTATFRSASASSDSVTLPSMLFSMGTTPRSYSPEATPSTMFVTDSVKSIPSATARAARWE